MLVQFLLEFTEFSFCKLVKLVLDSDLLAVELRLVYEFGAELFEA